MNFISLINLLAFWIIFGAVFFVIGYVLGGKILFYYFRGSKTIGTIGYNDIEYDNDDLRRFIKSTYSVTYDVKDMHYEVPIDFGFNLFKKDIIGTKCYVFYSNKKPDYSVCTAFLWWNIVWSIVMAIGFLIISFPILIFLFIKSFH